MIRAAALGAVLLLGLAVSSSPDSSPAPSPSTRGLEYVALGDSFSSGLGLGDPVPDSPPFCQRSTNNLPHLVARSLGATLTDVTCAGATTANIISSPLKYGKGSTPAQSNALSSRTDFVTITIGGNDLGFASATKSCVALGHDGPLLVSGASNCRSEFVHDGVDELAKRIDTAVAHGTDGESGLEKTFETIKKDAPNALVFVIGYPTILPDSSHTPVGGCFTARRADTDTTEPPTVNIFPFTDVDTIYLHSVQQKLDGATRSAAARAGFEYISMLSRTAANSACASPSQRFLNGVTVNRASSGSVTLRAQSLHPDELGTTFAAKVVSPAIAAEFQPSSEQHPQASAPAWKAIWILPLSLLVLAAGLILIALLRKRRIGG